MKKRSFLSTACFLGLLLTACNNNSSTATTNSDSTTSTTNTSTAVTTDTSNHANMNATSTTGASSTTASAANLSEADKKFIVEAAEGGMMEVQGGQVAQQKAANDRVKAFGQMMVQDHSQANDQLKTLAAQKGVTLPADISADMKKHLDAMQKLTGKAFDQHYMSMMNTDHNEDIAKFENEAKNGKDNDVKNWANQTLPVLKKHKDSVTAIMKMKM
jgi:putative membrane protein